MSWRSFGRADENRDAFLGQGSCPEPPGRAVAGFFRDSVRIGREPMASGSLLGLASFQAIVTAGAGAIVAQTLNRD